MPGHPPVVLHGFEADLPVAGTQDETRQRVIILAADGVELVVVAAGAGDGQAEERLGEDIDFVVDPVAFVLADIDGRMHFLAEERPTGAQDRFIVFGARTKAGRGEQVASEVLLQEAVVGHVFIEGPHEVVAVLPGVGDGVVGFVPARLGIAHQVHPVSGPPFTEMRRGQQSIHGLFAIHCAGRTRRPIEVLQVLGLGREPGHREAGPTQPNGVADRFRWSKPSLFEGFENEVIDRVLGPLSPADRGDVLTLRRFPKPRLCFAAAFQIEAFLGG